MIKKCSLLAVALSFAAPVALAYDITPTFDLPTTRTDGAVLDASEILEARLYSDCAGTPVLEASAVVSGATLMDLVAVNGTYSFCATVVDTAGQESAFSNIYSVMIEAIAPPGAPANFEVQVVCDAACRITVVGAP